LGAITGALRIIYKLTGITAHSTDPYHRLVSEIYDYLLSLTVPGGDFEGFKVYPFNPKNKQLFFPCLIIENEHGMGHHIFGREYKEGGAIVVKVMFTHKEFYILDVM